ncbi:Glycosyl transferase family protein OS=Sulfuricella denitrificans skB26 GN=SCD_n02395 PE=4 SV=1: Glycos_transf_2 [Gemmataceae bacterium]|nr:Glycosyl transferase family protein OS=Sulfuricella denitrificans skB26 GN=SCD_n02395 PE=4 SV=1: Glycos_transf_2 [Gemmataceae bacterium]VTU00909.1 Glycosyl transferase family protein OS=Sulfuricella denitrificans skB26 GN=SCD_n02395 PE=4 SV=1: Glycos_transf_2 [Gemmataceae bacterium]
MRVAVHDCFPNHETAEKELVHRFLQAFRNLGWEAARAGTSDDVVRFRPDCVLATHYTTPKATEFPTVGMMTNPPEYFDLFPGSLANVLSYDAYLPGSPAVARNIEDLHHSTGKRPLIDDAYFYLSSPRTAFPERPPAGRRLFYVGTRWDAGKRHGDLFRRLAAAVPLDIYGPEDRWRDLARCYRGRVPYDGVSMIDRIREAGIALAIHSPEHLRHGIPTMRVFESLAAGAVVITDAAEFGREHFGDSVLYVDTKGGRDVVDQIAAHVTWVRDNPAAAERKARTAHGIFVERFCLERLFARLPQLVERIKEHSGYTRPKAVSAPGAPDPQPPLVEYVVRAGTRPARFARRALDALKNQSHPNIGVVLVWLGGEPDLDTLTREYRDAFLSLKVVRAEASGVRSEALWAGLGELTAPFFGVLDDDDYLHPNHVATLLPLLTGPGAARLARSGGIRVQEDPGHYEDQSYFHGPLGDFCPENRALAYWAPVSNAQLLDGNRYVLSHSWVADRGLLAREPLRDPHLPVLEDVYLYSELSARAPCAFSWRATAEWNWRSETKDNACLYETGLYDALERLRLRLTYATGWVGRLPGPVPTKPRVTAAQGLWRSLTQVGRLLGRIERGCGVLLKDGVGGFYRRLTRVGTH